MKFKVNLSIIFIPIALAFFSIMFDIYMNKPLFFLIFGFDFFWFGELFPDLFNMFLFFVVTSIALTLLLLIKKNLTLLVAIIVAVLISDFYTYEYIAELAFEWEVANIYIVFNISGFMSFIGTNYIVIRFFNKATYDENNVLVK